MQLLRSTLLMLSFCSSTTVATAQTLLDDSPFSVPRGIPVNPNVTPLPAGMRMLSGVWGEAPPASASSVMVSQQQESITFLNFAGVGFDRPLHVGQDGAFRLRAIVEPVRNDVRSLGWLSFALSPTRDDAGWPTNRGHLFAMLLRSNGAIQVFSRGNEIAYRWEQGPPQPAERYQLQLQLQPGTGNQSGVLQVNGVVNEARFTASLLAGSVEASTHAMYLDLCAHYHEAPVESTVSSLVVQERIALLRAGNQ